MQFFFLEKSFTIILFLYCINDILLLRLVSQKNKLRTDSGQRCPSHENVQIKQLRWSAIQGFLKKKKKKICKSRGFPITKNNKNRDFCCCYLWQEKYVYTCLSVCHKHGGIKVLDGFSITWGEAGVQDIQEKCIKCLCRLTQSVFYGFLKWIDFLFSFLCIRNRSSKLCNLKIYLIFLILYLIFNWLLYFYWKP